MSQFKKASKQEKNPEARRKLDAFYKSLIRADKIKNYIMTEWAEDNTEAQILQYVGCDVALKYGTGKYKFVDEKVCKNYRGMLYFEMDNGSRKHSGWAVSEYKKTDIIGYFMEGVGLFLLPFQQLKQWLLDNESNLEEHYSTEDKGRHPNRNVRVHKDRIIEEFGNCFISIDELELLERIILGA